LNDTADGMKVIEEVAIENLRGWVEMAPSSQKAAKTAAKTTAAKKVTAKKAPARA